MYLKWGIGWLVLIFCVSGLWGGEACAKNIEGEKDSLLNIIRNSPHDTSTLRAYYNIGNLYLFNNPDSLAHYGKILMESAEKKQSPLFRGLAHQLLGSVFLAQNELTPALQHYIESINILESISPSPKELIAVYGQIVSTYAELTDFKSGQEYAEKCIALSKKRKDVEGLAVAYNNIGDLLDKQGKYEEAMGYYAKSLDIAKENGFGLTIAISYYNMGYVSLLQGKTEEAFKYITESEKRSRELRDNEGLIYCYIELGKLFQLAKDFGKARNYADSALTLNREYNNKKLMKDIYLLISDNFESEKRHDSAYLYFKKYTALKDSIYNEFRQKLVYSLTTNQKIQAMQQKALTDERALNRQKKTNNLLLILGVILLGALLFLFLLNQQKKKTNELLLAQKQQIEVQKEALSVLNETKDKLFSVISHDLRSPINQIKSLLLLLNNNVISKEDFMNIIQKFHTQIDSLSDNMENVLLWANAQLYPNTVSEVPVNISEQVSHVLMLNDSALSAKELSININIPENAVVKTTKEPYVIALRNLISNAIKFSHKGKEINIFLEETAETMSLTVADNGVGMTEEQLNNLFSQDKNVSSLGTMKEKGSGIGLKLTREFVEKNGGTLKVKSEAGKGTAFSLIYPKKR